MDVPKVEVRDPGKWNSFAERLVYSLLESLPLSQLIGGTSMQFWIQDVKFGVKLLWKNKAFAAAVVLSLGVCIAANSAIFSILHSVVLKPQGA